MTRRLLIFAVATFLSTGTVLAQEVGAGRVEVGSAIFAGGALFMSSSNASDPKFDNYVLGGAVTFNVSRQIGIEADLGLALGRRQDRIVNGAPFTNQKTPNMFMYSGNVIYNPAGRDHLVVPYLAGGLGAWTMFESADASSVGNRTYLATNVGGGVRWFPIRHWGVRADYRHIIVNNDVSVPTPLGPQEVRHANRLYGALVLTF